MPSVCITSDLTECCNDWIQSTVRTVLTFPYVSRNWITHRLNDFTANTEGINVTYQPAEKNYISNVTQKSEIRWETCIKLATGARNEDSKDISSSLIILIKSHNISAFFLKMQNRPNVIGMHRGEYWEMIVIFRKGSTFRPCRRSELIAVQMPQSLEKSYKIWRAHIWLMFYKELLLLCIHRCWADPHQDVFLCAVQTCH